MPLHRAREAAALGPAAHVHDLAGFEDVHRNQLTHFVLRNVVGAHFLEPPPDLAALQMAGLRFVRASDSSEPQLDRLVTVRFVGANLRDRARAGFDYRNGHDLTGVVEHLGHADLFTEKRLQHFLCL